MSDSHEPGTNDLDKKKHLLDMEKLQNDAERHRAEMEKLARDKERHIAEMEKLARDSERHKAEMVSRRLSDEKLDIEIRIAATEEAHRKWERALGTRLREVFANMCFAGSMASFGGACYTAITPQLLTANSAVVHPPVLAAAMLLSAGAALFSLGSIVKPRNPQERSV